MTNFAKLILGIAVLTIIGVVLVLYFTRASSAPSVPVEQAVEPLQVSERTLKIIPDESTASFTINEDLRGVPTKVIGVTNEIGGEFSVSENPAAFAIGEIKVNARTLKTDNDQRNGAIGRMILKSEDPANEFIVFKPSSIEGVPAVIEVGKEFQFTVVGDLTIKGVTKTATFTGSGTLNMDGSFKGSARTIILLADYDIVIPTLPFLANVEKQTEITVTIVAR